MPHTYVGGYIDDRIKSGEMREYHYPPDGGLPQFPLETEFPEFVSSFAQAQQLKAKQQASNKNVN